MAASLLMKSDHPRGAPLRRSRSYIPLTKSRAWRIDPPLTLAVIPVLVPLPAEPDPEFWKVGCLRATDLPTGRIFGSRRAGVPGRTS